MSQRLVGQPVRRKEDWRMIQGLATYVDDVDLPHLHHVAIVRSPFAHARIKGYDLARALAMPGVRDVVTGNDTRSLGGIPRASTLPEAPDSPRCPVLAEDVVRFVGEPVVAVVADTKAHARDAADAVEVDYDPLPVASDPEKALSADAPRVHESRDSNLAFDWTLDGGRTTWAEARAAATRIVRQRLVHQRLAPVPIETRGVVGAFDPGTQEITLWTSTQIPHLVRTFTAGVLGIPETRLRVIAPDVGGGFGSKLNVYREEALMGFLASRCRVPCKWIERRSENLQATIHGRGQIGEIQVAVQDDGRILGLHYAVVADLGAYHHLLTISMPAITGLMLSGAYAIPHITINVKGVFTNRMSTDAYRGAGRPEATFVIERAVDLVAAELGLDPMEVRRRNFPDAFPYETATGLVYDSGDYLKTLHKALEVSDYEGLRRMQADARAEGRHVGIGLSSYVEICALGPSKGMPCGGFGWESATVRVHPDGSATLLVGTSPHGQGQETSFAQIAADMLGCAMDNVDVVHGDTGMVQYGVGTFGSRGTAVGGSALYRALEQVVAKARRFAAKLLECAPEDVDFEDGVFRNGDRSLTFAQVAFAAHGAAVLPDSDEPGLKATAFFEPSNFTFPFGTHVCVVEVDPDMGDIKFLRYIAVDDCGKVINPMLVDGQIHGGIAQGLGQALLEEVIYDDEGQLLTGSLMDYAVPRAFHLPRFETHRTETPSPVNPLGAKGVGEAGTIGSTPALVNAVCDALRPLGVRHIDMPLTREKVWRAIQSAQGRTMESTP